jgi:hypothetical protein
MQRRFLFGALVVVAVLLGYPYAGLVLNHMMGTQTVVMIEHDGTRRTVIMGPGATHPDWLPVMPGALVVTAGRWLPSAEQPDEGDLEILTHAGADDVRRFYTDTLRRQGFDMKDLGLGPLSPPVAAYFGIDGMLYGYRAATKHEVSLDIRAASGLLLPSRVIEIHWRMTDSPQRLPGVSG